MTQSSKGRGKSKPVRVIAVTSGKGGVGKTNVTANLALALTQAGRKVLVWDADLGLANIDVLLGLKPQYNISHLLNGEKTLREILVTGPGGFSILPASSGVQELTHLGGDQKRSLLSELDEYEDDLDFLLIDTGAGVGENVTYFNAAAQQRLVVVTSEPTSIFDAYGLIKVMVNKYKQKRFQILPNQVKDDQEAKKVYSVLAGVADIHLDSISLDYLGFIPKDDLLPKAVKKQKAVLDAYPASEAGKSFKALAQKLLSYRKDDQDSGGLQFFWKRLEEAVRSVDGSVQR
ncbi:MAG: MinD/ParA family protein [Thermodesulfobacteriota bacterium]